MAGTVHSGRWGVDAALGAPFRLSVAGGLGGWAAPTAVSPASRTVLRRLAPVAVVALLAIVVQGWFPQLARIVGSPPARHVARSQPAPVHRDTGVVQAERHGVDVNGAVALAAHTPMPLGASGSLRIADPGYQASFDRNGFAYAPVGAQSGMSLHLTSIDRGGSAIPVHRSTWTAHPGAAVRDVSTGVTERVTGRTGSVEWDVVLRTRPAGTGDLRVLAALGGTAGATRVRDTGGPAWRFSLTGGGTAIMDRIVVKDRTGSVLFTGLPRIQDGHLALVVPAAVLDRAAYPLTIDPTVSAPHTVSSTGYAPAVAFNGTDYLVVWQQNASGSDVDILGARVSPSGSILSGPFYVSSDANPELHPDIAWNGSTFLVVFERQNVGNSDDALNNYDIYGQRLSSTGGLVGSNFVVRGGGLSDYRWDKQYPAVTSDQLDFYVVWQDSENSPSRGYDVYGKTVSRNGAVGFATAIAINTVDDTLPDVAWNGGTYVVVFQHAFSASDADIWAQRITPFSGLTLSDGTDNGDLLGGNFVIQGSGAYQSAPAIASEGGDELPCDSCADPTQGKNSEVEYTDNRNGTSDVYAAHLSSSGGILNNGTPLGTGSHSQSTWSKGIAFNGGQYFAVWSDVDPSSVYKTGIYGARLDTADNPQDSTPITVSDAANPELSPAVTDGDGSSWGVVYSNYPGTNFNGTPSVALRQVSPK